MTKRIGTCPVHHIPILQIYIEDEGEWLCLHRDTREQELQEIEQFKQSNL